MDIYNILNWIGVILTILGTLLISGKTPKPLLTNILYIIACVLLIAVFIAAGNWAMISMYVILASISLRGIYYQCPRKIREELI